MQSSEWGFNAQEDRIRCLRSFYQAVKDKIQNGLLESLQTAHIDPELVDKVVTFTQEKNKNY
jgi:hypothetical protein